MEKRIRTIWATLTLYGVQVKLLNKRCLPELPWPMYRELLGSQGWAVCKRIDRAWERHLPLLTDVSASSLLGSLTPTSLGADFSGRLRGLV